MLAKIKLKSNVTFQDLLDYFGCEYLKGSYDYKTRILEVKSIIY